MGYIGALLVTGLLGSAGHCLGMCGPLVVMMGLQFRGNNRPVILSSLLYHAARITVYVILGAIAGILGSLLGMAGDLSRAAGIASLLLGLGIIVLGLGYLGWLAPRSIDPSGEWINRAIGVALKQRGAVGILAMGGLNGLLPCGLVYGALLVAASTGGPVQAAAGMLAFGVGTLPALLIVGMAAGLVSVRLRQTMTRVAGIFMILIGLQLGLRGLSALGVVPHLHLRGLVIW